MEPMQNLKRFVAVLLILILPAVFILASFRNYSPTAEHEHGAQGHQHGEKSVPADDEKTKPAGTEDHGDRKPHEGHSHEK